MPRDTSVDICVLPCRAVRYADAHRQKEFPMSTNPTRPDPEPGPAATAPPTLAGRIGADWAAVIVAAVLVLVAVLGLLPSIPFLVK
jgi:hypothetical protein